MLIVDRRRRTGQVVNLIHLDIERKGDVMPDQLKVMLLEQMRDVAFIARIEIINTDNIITGLNQPITKMRATKPSAAGDQDTFWNCLNPLLLFLG